MKGSKIFIICTIALVSAALLTLSIFKYQWICIPGMECHKKEKFEELNQGFDPSVRAAGGIAGPMLQTYSVEGFCGNCN
jgi:hypothetical protein